MTVHYADESVTLHHGDALEVAQHLPDESVDCIVTSPPYFGLRSYLDDEHPDKASEHGAEPDPRLFVERLVRLFAELRRVLADDGTLWVNLGDSYSSGNGVRQKQPPQTNSTTVNGVVIRTSRGTTPSDSRDNARSHEVSGMPSIKNLLGMPWRTALALQDDGWILRNDIIWSKPNAMPESVTDRLSSRHEHLFMLTKSRQYHFDLGPIREPHVSTPGREGENYMRGQKAMRPTGPNSGQYSEGGRNPGDVWEIATQPFPGAHFATMPVRLAERCIQAGCKPGGTVLDPFSGSGTTGLAAARHGRQYVGIDLNADYLDLSLRTRLQEPTLNFGEPA